MFTLTSVRHSFRVTPHTVMIEFRFDGPGGQFCAPPRPIHRLRELPIQIMPDDAAKIRWCSTVLVVHLRSWSWRNFLRDLIKQNELWQFMLQIVSVNVTCVALRDDVGSNELVVTNDTILHHTFTERVCCYFSQCGLS